MTTNHADPIISDTPIMDTAAPSSPVQPRAVSTNHTDSRKASQSSGKDVSIHDEGSANGVKVSELKPIGIINEQNTCFLNSTFQAVRFD
jgi:ubiquitin C-terminal hydrolase